MKDRILQIRKENKLTQDAFAERLNLSKNFVWMLEKGERTASDRTISDICREFGVNENWLRTGEGEAAIKKTRSQEIGLFAGEVMNLPDENVKKRLIDALAKLDERDWETIEKIVNSIIGKEG